MNNELAPKWSISKYLNFPPSDNHSIIFIRIGWHRYKFYLEYRYSWYLKVLHQVQNSTIPHTSSPSLNIPTASPPSAPQFPPPSSDPSPAVCRDQDPGQCGEYGLIGCSDPVTSNFMKTNCRFTCKVCTVPTGDGENMAVYLMLLYTGCSGYGPIFHGLCRTELFVIWIDGTCFQTTVHRAK